LNHLIVRGCPEVIFRLHCPITFVPVNSGIFFYPKTAADGRREVAELETKRPLALAALAAMLLLSGCSIDIRRRVGA
jgi:hypothetical protein